MNRGHLSFHNHSPLMIINDFNVECVAILPGKTYAPLIVDSDAQLAFPVAGKPLQMIGRWNAEKVKRLGGVNLRKFPESNLNVVFQRRSEGGGLRA